MIDVSWNSFYMLGMLILIIFLVNDIYLKLVLPTG